jgi:phage FluMu gp28-like protein
MTTTAATTAENLPPEATPGTWEPADEKIRLIPPSPLLTQPAIDAICRYSARLPKHEVKALARWASTFWAFQQPWLFDTSDMAICNKARQIGTSHSTAAVAVLWGAFHGELTTIISIGQEESDEVLEKCKRHARLLQKLGSTLALTKTMNASEVVFAGGGRILALPSSGGRGFTGNVFLDEFGYQEHAGKVWDAAAPVTQLGYRMRVSSTPNGVGNEFHKLWTQARSFGSIWSPHQIPISKAKAEGYRLDMRKLWALAKGDPRIFAQMYECSFLDNELQYIPTDAITQCSSSYSLASLGNGEHYAGLDIGRTVDLTVLTVVRMVKGVRYVVHVESCKRTDWDGLESMVARAFEKYSLRRLCVDSTGLGAFPAERIKKKHSERVDLPKRRPKVECIDFTPNSKEDLATGLYVAFTKKTVQIPKLDQVLGTVGSDVRAGTAEQIATDVAAIRRIVTAANNIRYDAAHTSEGHADHAWSLALGLHACSDVNPMLAALSA